MAASYTRDEIIAIYELGRLYYEMGYYVAAERIFNGLCVIDGGQSPGRLGVALVKLERGSHNDAIEQFRLAVRNPAWALRAKLGLCSSLAAMGDKARCAELLRELQGEVAGEDGKEIRQLYNSLAASLRS